MVIFPEILSGSRVLAFFTSKKPGIEGIERIGGINKGSLYLPIQKHTSRIVILESDLSPVLADAVLTQREGIMIGVEVADCVPILLYDRNKQVIGAVHAGWRGTASGILMKTIETMIDRFSSKPSDIILAIGPSIKWCCYDVGYEVIEGVVKVTGKGEYVLQRDDRYYLDLPSANRYQAIKMGVRVENIWVSGICTYCEHERFYSYRFSKDGRRQGGYIVLKIED